MSCKRYSFFVLILTPILISCSSCPLKSDNSLTNKINFSERISLAALGKKMDSGISSEDNKAKLEPSCVFGGGSDSMDISKFRAVLGDKFKEGVDKSAPLNKEQIKRAFDLLRTGEVKDDISNTTIELFKKILGFPRHLLITTPKVIIQTPT